MTYTWKQAQRWPTLLTFTNIGISKEGRTSDGSVIVTPQVLPWSGMHNVQGVQVTDTSKAVRL